MVEVIFVVEAVGLKPWKILTHLGSWEFVKGQFLPVLVFHEGAQVWVRIFLHQVEVKASRESWSQNCLLLQESFLLALLALPNFAHCSL